MTASSAGTGRSSGHVMPAAPGGVPQHNFHVFAVYPWLGLLRAGMDGPPLEVLDRCRIRWGHVEAVTGDHVTVRSRRLRFEDSRLTLGAEQIEQARHSFESAGLHDRPAPRRRCVPALGLGVRPTVTRVVGLAPLLHLTQSPRRQRSRSTGPRRRVRRVTGTGAGMAVFGLSPDRIRRNRARTDRAQAGTHVRGVSDDSL